MMGLLLIPCIDYKSVSIYSRSRRLAMMLGDKPLLTFDVLVNPKGFGRGWDQGSVQASQVLQPQTRKTHFVIELAFCTGALERTLPQTDGSTLLLQVYSEALRFDFTGTKRNREARVAAQDQNKPQGCLHTFAHILCTYTFWFPSPAYTCNLKVCVRAVCVYRGPIAPCIF